MRAEIKGGGKLMRRRNLKVALVNTVLAAIILGLYFALSLSPLSENSHARFVTA